MRITALYDMIIYVFPKICRLLGSTYYFVSFTYFILFAYLFYLIRKYIFKNDL